MKAVPVRERSPRFKAPANQPIHMTTDQTGRVVHCRECGESISPRAELCPHCGVRQHPAPTGSEKNPGLAAVASFIIPGLGQVYNGDIAKGIIAGIVVLAAAMTVVGLILAIPLWVWLVYDAYKTAEQLNQPPAPAPAPPPTAWADPLLTVLRWYRDNHKGSGFTKNVINAVESKSLPELSEQQLEWIIKAIPEYERAAGTEIDEERKQAVVTAWEHVTGETFEASPLPAIVSEG